MEPAIGIEPMTFSPGVRMIFSFEKIIRGAEDPRSRMFFSFEKNMRDRDLPLPLNPYKLL